MHSLSKTIFLPIFSLIALSFSQCTTSLAPQFNELIFSELSSSSEEILVFFASIEKGTESKDFDDREETYHELIGKFEALELETRARPIPGNGVLTRVNKALEIRGSTSISGDYPSAHAMGKIAETLQMMKNTDEQNDMGNIAVKTFKNQILIYLDQALTYENFLNR